MFDHISSTANDTVKLLKSLDRKKDRQETGLFLAEGAHFAEEALTLKETGRKSKGPRGPVAQQDIKAGLARTR